MTQILLQKDPIQLQKTPIQLQENPLSDFKHVDFK